MYSSAYTHYDLSVVATSVEIIFFSSITHNKDQRASSGFGFLYLLFHYSSNLFSSSS